MQAESVSPTSKYLFAFTLLSAVIALATISIPLVQAQTFHVIHSFSGSNGSDPMNGLVIDAAGNLYGTASAGGKATNGVVFMVTSKGVETVLHKFIGGVKDGSGPQGSLVRDSLGNLYGTTAAGGTHGAGTVFEVSGLVETVLYNFAGQNDGTGPQAGLTMDATGNLYGTTAAGGTSGNGTVFKLAVPSVAGGPWKESVLYSFGTGTDGATPVGGVVLDASGNVYGTTSAGGAYALGTIFQLTPGSPWTETILHDFQDANDGAVPYASLIFDKAGNLYGTATEGGANGGGTIFELTPSNDTWNFTSIYSVPGWGISGSFRSVVLDPSSGKLYGTTHCDGEYNSGTVYELTPSGGSWTYDQLYTFTGGKDGLYSFSNLVLNQGVLYGTTKYGGTSHKGVIFQVTP